MKNIFKSKTFWFNLLALAGDLTGLLPGSSFTIPIISAVNIGLRTITKQPVSILPTED